MNNTATNSSPRGAVKYRRAHERLERARRLALSAQHEMLHALKSHVGEDLALSFQTCVLPSGDSDPIFKWPETLDLAIADIRDFASEND